MNNIMFCVEPTLYIFWITNFVRFVFCFVFFLFIEFTLKSASVQQTFFLFRAFDLFDCDR